MSVSTSPPVPACAGALARSLRKAATIFSVYMQDNLTYRGQALIWMLTDAVPGILMPLVWLASYQGRTQIGGFSPTAMVVYYLVSLCLTNVMITHIMWDIAMEVREGRFSIYLTRPYSYMAFQYFGNLSWRIMRLGIFLPVLLVWAVVFRPYLRWEGYSVGWAFWAAVVGGHFLSFLTGYALGMLALFFTEVRSIYAFYYMPFSFLSGSMVPLALLPGWAEKLADWLPFRYTLAFAVEVFLNRLSPDEMRFGFAVMGGWLVLTFLACKWLSRRGLRHYTGVGM